MNRPRPNPKPTFRDTLKHWGGVLLTFGICLGACWAVLFALLGLTALKALVVAVVISFFLALVFSHLRAQRG